MIKIIKQLIPKTIKKFIKKLIKKAITKFKFLQIKSPEDIVNFHFQHYSSTDHINFQMFLKIFSTLQGRPLNIFETGSSAWGTNSSVLFDSYIRKFGGTFITVDIRPEPSIELNKILSRNSKTFTQDSVQFINEYNTTYFKNIDLVYLDSFDLDLENPEPSMKHGYKEFSLLDKKIKIGCIIIIDDTPSDLKYFDNETIKIEKSKFIPGKGALVFEEIKENKNYEILFHEYALAIKKIK